MRILAVLVLAVMAITALDSLVPGASGFGHVAQAQENPPAADPANVPSAKDETLLMWTFSALGWRYTLSFLFLSFCFVALLVMNLLAARRESVCPAALVEQFESHLKERRYQEAYELAKSDESFLGKVLSAGLANLNPGGYEKAVSAMQEVGEDENMRIEHRLSYMALIGTISPMVGLLGTVDGMVQSFSVIANSPAAPKPSELAKGISMALITTLVGLVIAIPALAVFNILKNRFARLILEAGIYSESLMGRFESVGKK
ncbi:MAG: MotA/TolQ/ExbB proton channel family protein [Planctomycetes bacterium]|nr:MotA/TolQ/ExbB proton channel family protein [Planctomycetota bacterium]